MRRFYLALCVALLLPSFVLAIGGDHPAGPITGGKSWPYGMEDLVNRKDRIHGYWVNAEDIFFFAGETQALNDFFTKYAKLNDTKLVIVLHPGTHDARSPWDKGEQAAKADWRLYIAPKSWVIDDPEQKIKATDPATISKVDVWLGGKVKLAYLRVPKEVALESGSDSTKEIQDFVRKNKR
jgi:hypothetical protein